MDVETFAVTSEAGMELCSRKEKEIRKKINIQTLLFQTQHAYNAAYYAAGQERSVVVGRRRAHPAELVG